MSERMVELTIDCGEPTGRSWCPDCNVSTVLTVPLNVLSDTGCNTVTTVAYCERCFKRQPVPA